MSKHRNKDNEIRQLPDKRGGRDNRLVKAKENKMTKKCVHCNSPMRARGTSDGCGGFSFKCRNKKCGRTTWEWKKAAPPVPIVYSGIPGR